MQRTPSALLLVALIFLLPLARAYGDQTLKLNEAAPVGGPEEAALTTFKKAIEDGTNGSIKIELHFKGELGNPQDSLENMMAGDLELYSSGLENYLPLMIDEMTPLTLPFLLPDNAAALRYLKSPLMADTRGKVLDSRRIRFLEMDDARGPYRVMISTKPIMRPTDLRNLRLAILPEPSKVGARLWQELGASLTKTSLPNIYNEFKKGSIDAVVVPDISVASTLRLTEVAPYIIAIKDYPQFWQISIYEGLWKKLAAKDQKIFTNATCDASRVFHASTEHNFISDKDAMIAKDNAIFIEFDVQRLTEKLMPVYNELISEGAITPPALSAARASEAVKGQATDRGNSRMSAEGAGC